MSKKRVVKIEVLGGFAQVVDQQKDINVIITDHDNKEKWFISVEKNKRLKYKG